MDHVADEVFRGVLSQARLFVYVADYLSAEKPQIVDVVLDGSFRQTGLGEVKEEGHEVFHKLSADRKILFLSGKPRGGKGRYFHQANETGKGSRTAPAREGSTP